MKTSVKTVSAIMKFTKILYCWTSKDKSLIDPPTPSEH